MHTVLQSVLCKKTYLLIHNRKLNLAILYQILLGDLDHTVVAMAFKMLQQY